MSRSVFGETVDGRERRCCQRIETDLDITPMIDVTFLLLIFFMITSTMQATPDLDIPPARHGVGVDSRSAIRVVITRPPSPDDAPAITIEGHEVTLQEVREAVAEGLQQGRDQVLVMADREIPHGFVTEVERAATESDRVTLQLGVRDRNR